MQSGPHLRQLLSRGPAAFVHRRRAAEAEDGLRILRDRLALGRQLARLPSVVGIEQGDPVAFAELRQRGVAHRGRPVATRVVDDRVLVRRRLLVERRPERLVQERGRRFHGHDQADAHTGSVSV